ncbi:uncharacterized protein TNCV_465761 [Trichonephila clavipes]|nr:uncharacterized protein TNCV_465761 [Trichonephila clavipes]
MDINFCVRLGKSATETYEILKQIEGRESVEDDKRSGLPQTSHPAEKIKKVSATVRKDRLQTIAESVGISFVTCQWVLTKDLNMHRVCQHIVPCMLNEDQSTNEIKNASQAELNGMAKNGFQKYFDDHGQSVLLLKGLILKEHFNW